MRQLPCLVFLKLKKIKPIEVFCLNFFVNILIGKRTLIDSGLLKPKSVEI